MAMNLRLSESETEALRAQADLEGRSMNDVARDAIRRYVSDRRTRMADAIKRVATEDAELLDRLGQ